MCHHAPTISFFVDKKIHLRNLLPERYGIKEVIVDYCSDCEIKLIQGFPTIITRNLKSILILPSVVYFNGVGKI